MRSRQRRLGRGVLSFLVMLAIVLLVYWLPAFHVQSIQIGDLRQVNKDDILASSGLEIGQHLLSGLGGSAGAWLQLRYGGAEQQLADSFPFVREAVIKMDFPAAISIEIEERMEIAYLVIPDGYVMIDKEGVALTAVSSVPGNIPVIDGITVSTMTLGQPLTVDVPTALNGAITLMGAIIEADMDQRIEMQLLPQIKKLLPISNRKVFLTVVLPNTGEALSVTAETGEDAVDDMLWLRYAVAQGAFDGKGRGILDLTGSHKTFTPD